MDKAAKIPRSPWMTKTTNSEVLYLMNEEIEIVNSVKVRKLEYIVHIK